MLMLDNSVFNFANIYHTTSNRQNLRTKIMMGDCPQMIGTHRAMLSFMLLNFSSWRCYIAIIFMLRSGVMLKYVLRICCKPMCNWN